MKTTYRRNLHKSYMCITEQEGLVREYERKILESQRIPHLLKMQTMVVDGQESYLYEISGKQQIEDYLSGKRIDYDILRKLLFAVEVLCCAVSEYLLRENGICLESEYIYINLEDGEVYFTYLPFWEKSLPESFEYCMEWILRKIDHKDQAAAELGYQVYQMCGRKNVSIKKMLENARQRAGWGENSEKEGIERYRQEEKDYEKDRVPKEGRKPEHCNEAERSRFLEREVSQKLPKEEQGKKYFWKEPFRKMQKWVVSRPYLLFTVFSCQGEKERKPVRMKWPKKSIWKEKFEKKWKKTHFQGEGFQIRRQKNEVQREEKSTVISCIEEKRIIEEKRVKPAVHPTEILNAGKQRPAGKLIYHGIHGCGDIWITKETFLLGKSRQQAEGIIDAEGVSRLHARISREGDTYYIEDLNSTNGTYLNEIPLQYRQKKELCKDDCIRFGAEEYLFS